VDVKEGISSTQVEAALHALEERLVQELPALKYVYLMPRDRQASRHAGVDRDAPA
jgi:hypothetical protein